jgi:hypothetical protein
MNNKIIINISIKNFSKKGKEKKVYFIQVREMRSKKWNRKGKSFSITNPWKVFFLKKSSKFR